jgi:hypothetical protein
MGNERFAKELACEIASLGSARDKLHAASFAAAAGMNLSLDDGLGLSERFECFSGLIGGRSSRALGYGSAKARQNLLGLKLVDVHFLFKNSGTTSLIFPPFPVLKKSCLAKSIHANARAGADCAGAN